MTPLNSALYRVLERRFGRVKISHPGEERQEEWDQVRRKLAVIQPGEHYAVCCPLCGDSTFRLSISYRWLTPRHSMTRDLRADLAHCYNESCEVYKPEFYTEILEDIRALRDGELLGDLPQPEYKPPESRTAELPTGFKLLITYPVDHPCRVFVRNKYPHFDHAYLSEKYCVGFCEGDDMRYPFAKDRVLFPIFSDSKLVSWQGRTINPNEKKRWFLPPGFVKCVYNGDNVGAEELPVIAEGIPAAIACGLRGTAVFGKEISDTMAYNISKKWASVVIATDPETFLPDNRPKQKGKVYAQIMKDTLDRYLRVPAQVIRYPEWVMEIAKKHNNSAEDISVPDPADLGMEFMAELLRAETSSVV